ncbi:SH3 domain-containing protein [Sergentomyia squamirostris]
MGQETQSATASTIIAPKFKAKAPASGIWSPTNKSEPNLSESQHKISESSDGAIPLPPPPPVWTPRSAGPSPQLGCRKTEFRPVPFESPTLTRRRYTKNPEEPSSPPIQPPWTQPEGVGTVEKSPNSPNPLPNPSNSVQRIAQSFSTPGINQLGQTSLPRSQNPTVTLLQKAREERSTKVSQTETTKAKSNEIIHPIRQDFSSVKSGSNYDTMTDVVSRQSENAGQTIQEGMPIVLRTQVQEDNQSKWYKKVYNTIHKAKDDDEYMTVRYKTRRGRYPYKSNGYMSEPEPNYDSDYSFKYSTLDRRRTPSTGSQYDDSRLYGTMPNPIRSGHVSFRNQPGRIEDYTPGRSSVSEKETREHLDQQRMANTSYSRGYLSRALKEGGYESDSSLVFRKREDATFTPLSPIEQKQAYKSVQAGGEPPLQGFRKPAPEKPKDEAEPEIEYIPITSTLTKIRVHRKVSAASPKNREIICYPITSITRPIDMFGAFPKEVKSYVPPVPPAPPNRKSSKINSTLKLFSQARIQSPRSHRETCFTSTAATSKGGRSRSASATYSASSIKEEKNLANSTKIQASKQVCRMTTSAISPRSHSAEMRRSSPSPVAFGRSISKERTFAEEKKRLEEALPQCRKLKTVTTRILRKGNIKSPDEVKKAIQNTFRMPTVKDKPGATHTQRSGRSKLGSSGSSTKFAYHITSGRNTSSKTTDKSNHATITVSPANKTIHKASSKPRNRSISKTSSPTTVTKTMKSSTLLKSTKTTGKSSSNLSLARTNSTYSIDSTNSKRHQPITRYPLTINVTKTKKGDKGMTLSRVESEIVKFESDLQGEIDEKHRELRNSVNRSIKQHSDNIKSDSFFQNLFLRDFAPPPATHVPSSTVLDKVHQWNNYTTKSEPSLRRTNSYLIQKRPVTSSKFKMLEREHFRQSRSLSPIRSFRPGRLSYEHISKFDSFYQLTDEEEEFGSMAEISFQERSRSEPPGNTVLTEIIRPNSPVVIHGRRSITDYRESSRSSTRSPSCRRIQSFRSTTQQTSVEKAPVKGVARARSLNSADRDNARRDFLNDQLSHSSSSLNILEKHSPICHHRKSDRFKELNRFYANLERVGQLEIATSSTDLRPIRRQEEIIDFDLWRKIRAHEKAEKELNYLVGKLKEEQKDHDFLFRPKDVEDVKWNQNHEPGLRIKEKSVEDLKELFQQKAIKSFPDDEEKQEIESTKDTYKPFWRGNSVLDLATNMVYKYNFNDIMRMPRRETTREEKCFGLSRKLVSTLSKDQVAKLKHQLNEIYSSGQAGEGGKQERKYEEVSEKYVVTVPVSTAEKKKPVPLTVRSHSLVSRKDLLAPVLKRHQARIALDKAESISSINDEKVTKVIHKFENVVTKSDKQNQLTEVEKKRLSASLCHEIKDLVAQRRQRMASPSVITAKETRGAIAAESAKESLPGRPYYSIELTETHQSTAEGDSMQSMSHVQAKSYRTSDNKKTVQQIVVKETTQRPASKAETESGSSEASNRTVIYRSGDPIKNKIEYFEEKKNSDNVHSSTIYHAREDSSPDEEEIMKMVNEKVKARKAEAEKKLQQEMSASQSFTDLREIFGEKTSVVSNYKCKKSRSVSPAKSPIKTRTMSPEKSISNTVSIESVSMRSRSISPDYADGLYRSYLNMINTGDVQKMKHRFESLSISPSPVAAGAPRKPRRFQSDPDLSKTFLGERGASPVKTTIRDHEMGDVSWITHKFETRNAAAVAERSRSRTRRTSSPIQKVAFRRDDRRFMPHIDIISKTASLKREIQRTTTPFSSFQSDDAPIRPGEVEKIRHKFEENDNMSLLGHMYTSVPDITELKDISSYLHGSWVAHRYPKPQDNARSLYTQAKLTADGVTLKRRGSRPSSTSPPRTKSLAAKILRPFYDVFADQKFDPLIHRPKSRYVPDRKREAETLWKKLNGNIRKASVKFQENAVVPPPPPIKGVPLNGSLHSPESPRRYVESDVNIHYRSPIRYEYKDAIPEEELALRQAEAMKKLYQEERRRKYLQELQDMSNRRHTDLHPNQKSPIPLNRYDDFGSDDYHKQLLPRTVARALFNFQGQSARELSFKKGDIIYIRRQIDGNWYEGEHNAMLGLLPVNYVEIISKDGVRCPTKPKPTEGQARAKYNFNAQSAIELSLNKGELVKLTRRVDDNWFEGRIANRKGIFPVAYVEVLTDIGSEDPHLPLAKPVGSPAAHSLITPAQETTPYTHETRFELEAPVVGDNGVIREMKTVKKTEVLHVDTNSDPIPYRALYKYRPQNPDEMEMDEGDIVYVLEKCDDGWFVGTSQKTGCFGTFPGNYVEKL